MASHPHLKAHLKAGLVVALTLAAGAAQGIWAPASCPPDSERKNQPQSDIVPLAVRSRTPQAAAQPRTVTRNVTVLRQADGEQECEICIEDGQVRATVNGQPVEASRIQRDGDQIRIMGEDGQERMIVRVSPEGGAFMQPGGPAMLARRMVPLALEQAGQAREQAVRAREMVPQIRERIQRRIQSGDAPQALRRRVVTGQSQEGQPNVFRLAPSGQGQPGEPQVFRWAPEAPGQDGGAYTFRWAPGGEGQDGTHVYRFAPEAGGEVRALRVPHPPQTPSAPGAPSARRVPQPPTPPAPPARGHGGRAGPQVSGQIVIMGPDGQTQTIDLGDVQAHGGRRAFAVPGGQGQIHVAPVPGAHAGHGGGHTFRFQAAPGAPAQGQACCEDCKQDGSCCPCGAGAQGSGGGPGQPGFHGSGQIIIDTGDGQPRVIELGDLGAHMGQLHNHLLQLHGDGHGDHAQAHEGHMRELHNHLMDLQGLEGLRGMNIDLDGLTAQIEVELADALEGIEGIDTSALFDGQTLSLDMLDNGQLELQIEAVIDEALGGFDFEGLGRDIQAQVEAALEQAGVTSLSATLNADLAEGLGLDGGTFTIDLAPEALELDGEFVVEVEPQAAVQPGQPTPPRRARTGSSGGGGQHEAEVREGQRIREMRTPSTVTTFGQMTEQPRVMVGITMGDAPAETLESLGIEGSAIRIDRVIEGLPADEAGLKPGAIVVSIEGEEPATVERLREVLGQCNPGDTITVEVIARGEREEITIELAAYDAEALKVAMEEVAPTEESGTQTWTLRGDARAHHDELQARIAEAIEGMTASGVTDIDPEALREKIEAIVRDHLSQFQGMEGFTYHIVPGAQGGVPGRMLVAPGAHGGHGEAGEMLFVQPRVAPMPPDAPAAPGAPAAERRGSNVDARLNELSDRLTRLEERLDRLMQMMERGRD